MMSFVSSKAILAALILSASSSSHQSSAFVTPSSSATVSFRASTPRSTFVSTRDNHHYSTQSASPRIPEEQFRLDILQYPHSSYNATTAEFLDHEVSQGQGE
jgi:hypothetical protein